MKYYLFILIAVFCLISCDELFNPSTDDSYAIEKTLAENAMTQELTSGDDIKITVTGGTIKEETEIKVKKVSASDVPNLTLDKTTIGKNIFKIKIKGQKTFSPALKIEIKYDDEYLKSKNLTTADIKGLVHLPSGWVLGDYTIDETNNKIIFSISSTSLLSKVKDGLLDDEDEITICDGYTTTDSGQSDNPLKRYNTVSLSLGLGAIYYDDDSENSNVQWNLDTYVKDKLNMKWEGDKFVFERLLVEPKTWITDYETKPDTTVETVIGTISAKGNKIIKFDYELYEIKRTYYDGERPCDFTVHVSKYSVENVDIDLPDFTKSPKATIYKKIDAGDLKNHVKNISDYYYHYYWDSFYDKEKITEKKSVSVKFEGSYSWLMINFLTI